MIFSFRLHQELVAKQNRQTIRSAVCHFSGGDLFDEFPHRTSAGTFVPAQGTVALHCPVARLISESFLMSRKDYLSCAGFQPELLCMRMKS
jgi:hypothetical protein